MSSPRSRLAHRSNDAAAGESERHRIASHRIASHRIASHRIASHRIASHRIQSRIALHHHRNSFASRAAQSGTAQQNATIAAALHH
jgi:hypothetical protein